MVPVPIGLFVVLALSFSFVLFAITTLQHFASREPPERDEQRESEADDFQSDAEFLRGIGIRPG